MTSQTLISWIPIPYTRVYTTSNADRQCCRSHGGADDQSTWATGQLVKAQLPEVIRPQLLK